MKVARAVSILCVLVLSAACGGDAEGGGEGLLPPEPSPAPEGDEEVRGVAGQGLPEGSGETGSEEDRVLIVLDRHCGACHGRLSDADTSAEPGPLEFTNDVDRMVALGIIAPFNGAFSPLVQVMEDDSMPPPGVAPRPTESEITMIRAFIDDPRLWPELPPVE